MKLIRVLLTILFALLLFPTIWFSLQATIVYLTLYDTEFIQEVGQESDLSEQLIDTTIDYAISAIDSSSLELSTPLDESLLLDELLEGLDRVALRNIVDDIAIGTHQFLFADQDSLPTIDTLYLQELGDLGLSLASQQILDELAKVSADLNPEAMEGMNIDSLLQEQLPTLTIPSTVDFHQVVTTIYNNDINPISSIRLITFQLPQYFIWVLGILLAGIPLLYLIINRFRIVATLQFVALTGLIATLFSLIGTVLLYWFLPNATAKATDLLTSDLFLLDSSMGFLELLASKVLAKAITIHLFVLIGFILVLILTELKKKLYPTEQATDTTTEALLQISGTLLIALLIGFFVNYQWQRAVETVSDYQLILSQFDSNTIDVNPTTLLETLNTH